MPRHLNSGKCLSLLTFSQFHSNSIKIFLDSAFWEKIEVLKHLSNVLNWVVFIVEGTLDSPWLTMWLLLIEATITYIGRVVVQCCSISLVPPQYEEQFLRMEYTYKSKGLTNMILQYSSSSSVLSSYIPLKVYHKHLNRTLATLALHVLSLRFRMSNSRRYSDDSRRKGLFIFDYMEW